MNPRSVIAALTLGGALAVPALGADSPGSHDLTPLPVRGQFLPGIGFLAFDPESADVLPRGHWQVSLVETVANSFAKSAAVDHALHTRAGRGPVTPELLEGAGGDPARGVFYIDGETRCTTLRVSHGTGDGMELALVLRGLDFGGGALDATIERFHSTFALDQGGRLGAERDQYEVYLHPRGREAIAQRSPAGGFGDAVLSAKLALPKPAANGDLAFEAVLKVPAGRVSDLYSSGSVDVGGRLLYSRFWRNSALHASAGVLRLGPSERLGTGTQTLLSALLAFEQRLAGSRASVSLQGNYSPSPLRGLGLRELSEALLEVSAGVSYQLRRDGAVFFALTENVAHFNNSADLSAHVGWTKRF